MKVQFERSGEIIRDIGIMYFYKILKKIDETGEISPNLERNRVIFNNFDEDMFSEYILKNIFYKIFVNSIIPYLRKEKNSEIFIEKLIDSEINDFDKILKEFQLTGVKKDEIKKKYEEAKYFPYLRNSAKYGANSQSEENFHKNFRKLVKIVFHNVKGDRSILETYSLNEICSICHKEKATKYDITHKYEQGNIEKIKEKDRKNRINSKYNYTFMGSESNTFNNYSKEDSNICFTCEFFNLMFLLYVNLERPKVLAYTKSLEEMEFLNHKIMLKRSYYTEQGFYSHLAKYSMNNVKLYNLETDTNKGLILKLVNVTDFRKIFKKLEFMDIIDNYSFAQNSKEKKEKSKNQLLYGNIMGVREFLLGEIINEDHLYFNVIAYKKFVQKIKTESLKEGLGMGVNEVVANEYKKIGRYLQNEKKENLAFRLIQLLKSDSRSDLLVEISHAYLASKNEKPRLPKNFSGDILYADKLELHFYIMNTIEGLLETKGGEK